MEMQAAIDYVLEMPPLALITNFDGIISEIPPTPESATVDPGCGRSLAKLSGKLALVAVLSGRPVHEVRDLLGLPQVVYIGTHGWERWQEGRRHIDPRARQYAPVVHQIVERARQELALPDLKFEEKAATACAHLPAGRRPGRSTAAHLVGPA